MFLFYKFVFFFLFWGAVISVLLYLTSCSCCCACLICNCFYLLWAKINEWMNGCDFVITLLAFRTLLSKAINRLLQIYHNKLKSPLWVFVFPLLYPHDPSCIMLNIDWTPLTISLLMVNVRFNVRFYAISYDMFPTVDSCRCDSISGGKCLDTYNINNFPPL